MNILRNIKKILWYSEDKLKMKLHDWNFLKNKKQKAWLKALSHIKNNNIIALETGRIRNPDWKISDGNSTSFLTRLKKIKTLISIDNDAENYSGFKSSQDYCENYLNAKQLNKIQFINGDSVSSIKNLPDNTRLDFVLLDSANDPNLILKEFKAVELFLKKPLSVVVIDDISMPGEKGNKVIPYLTAKGYKEHKIQAFPCDCSYFIITDSGSSTVFQKNKFRPTFLLKAYNFVSKIYWEIHSTILTYLYLQSWKKRLISFQNQFGIEVNIGLKKHPASKMKIDVVIPVAHKDMEILPYCINSIQEHVKHPINKIFIISSKTDDITTFCNTNNCTFIEEDTILPINKKGIKYKVGTKDRSGWLFQQLLKLSGDTISTLDNYLIVDADTVYIRHRVFEQNNKTIFDISDEYHYSYFETYKKLLGSNIFLPASFTNHNMLINISVLKELKKKIEKRNQLKWYQAILTNIDKKESSFISEQETYGTYMFQNYRNKMILEYWFNLSLKRAKISNIKNLKRILSPFYKSLSFHSYYE